MMCRTVLRARAQGREDEERRQDEEARAQTDNPRKRPGEQRSDLTESCNNEDLPHGLIRRATAGSDMKRGGQREGRTDPDARHCQPEYGNRRAAREKEDLRAK